jgi:hypothetical protein
MLLFFSTFGEMPRAFTYHQCILQQPNHYKTYIPSNKVQIVNEQLHYWLTDTLSLTSLQKFLTLLISFRGQIFGVEYNLLLGVFPSLTKATVVW